MVIYSSIWLDRQAWLIDGTNRWNGSMANVWSIPDRTYHRGSLPRITAIDRYVQQYL